MDFKEYSAAFHAQNDDIMHASNLRKSRLDVEMDSSSVRELVNNHSSDELNNLYQHYFDIVTNDPSLLPSGRNNEYSEAGSFYKKILDKLQIAYKQSLNKKRR